MLESLVTLRTRIKLLIKLFLKGGTYAHLRGLESNFRKSSNTNRIMINRFGSTRLLYPLPDCKNNLYLENLQPTEEIKGRKIIHFPRTLGDKESLGASKGFKPFIALELLQSKVVKLITK